MACFLAMDGPAVRVQLPAGEVFAPAFVDAVQKYASRRGFSVAGTERFVSILEPSVVAIHTAEPRAVELIVADDGGSISTELHGVEARHRIADAAKADVEAAVSTVPEVERLEVDVDSAVVRFTIVID